MSRWGLVLASAALKPFGSDVYFFIDLKRAVHERSFEHLTYCDNEPCKGKSAQMQGHGAWMNIVKVTSPTSEPKPLFMTVDRALSSKTCII